MYTPPKQKNGNGPSRFPGGMSILHVVALLSETKSLDSFLSNLRSFADDTLEMGLIKES